MKKEGWGRDREKRRAEGGEGRRKGEGGREEKKG